MPPADGAAPGEGNPNTPRTNADPFTSRVAAGLVVPIPTLPPDSRMADGSKVHGAVNLAIWFAVAVPSLVSPLHAVFGTVAGNASGVTPEAAAGLFLAVAAATLA